MRSIRLHKDWPKQHNDFIYVSLDKYKKALPNILDYDFYQIHQGGRITDTIIQGKNRFGFYANNKVKATLETINWKQYKWMCVGNFEVVTPEILIYAYEKYKNT